MNAETSRSAQRATVTNMDDIAQNVQFLSEKTLQDIAKGQLVKLALNCDDNQ
jgi:phosphopantothenate synthetase